MAWTETVAFRAVGRLCAAVAGLALLTACAAAAEAVEIASAPKAASVKLAADGKAGLVIVSADDFPVVKLAAGFFAEDVARATGTRPVVAPSPEGDVAVIAGTLGHSQVIDQLARSGKLKQVEAIKTRWEATLSEIVENPLPGVKRALVIVGSDRRGTAYGLMQLSEKIGVSPWYWWADMPVRRRAALYLQSSAPDIEMPGVKYRGIFINDEDWGLIPWVQKTFDPKQGNIGPKTYEKVYELMLRLRLNYLWPAMHGVSTEFGAIPENAALADKYGIVMGSSHCEPMLFNNVHWDEKTQGKWDYTVNKDAIHGIWQKTAKDRSEDEAVWTIGIRGIHDAGMEGPNDTPTRMATLTEVFKDQRAIIDQTVTKKWGPVAQIFVPYKEVLPIYDAGLEVPPDASLVWVDDNFGYIRRLSNPAERKRPGGSGVYWHLSYYGGPHSYTWINTTPPALMWEELHKAWENDARTVWVINVGDIKPMEIGIDYFSKLAWAPDSMGPDSAAKFLHSFAAQNFGKALAPKLSAFLAEYYRLGSIRKPELMQRAWALSLTPQRAAELTRRYTKLATQEKEIAAAIPPAARDAYVETIGFPARVLSSSGLIFMADRQVQNGVEAAANEKKIASLRDGLTAEVDAFNTKLAGGKWNGMMPGLVTGQKLSAWSSQVRWPWGEEASQATPAASPAEQNWRDAASANRQAGADGAAWHAIDGLGITGKAVALLPASLSSSWRDKSGAAPYLEYDFTSKAQDQEAFIDFLPSFRTYPGMKLDVAVRVDGKDPVLYEVPGSSGSEDERGTIRSDAVQNNYVRLRVPLPQLEPGKHRFRITAVDPGAVIERVWLP